MNQRKIIHVDMDAFYASIEQRDHPEYRGKPIAVGRPEMRGVVAAASYEARRFGVRSAMPSMKALKLCPHLIFTRNRMDVYKAVSAQIHAIFHRYTDLVEPLSLDEAFLDVTENKPGIPLAVDIARRIKKEIRRELHLTASAGVSYNKFLAKIASDYRKPVSYTHLRAHESRGLGDVYKRQETYRENVTRAEALEQRLPLLAEELAGRLARSGFRGNTLTLKVKFPDFVQKTRCATVPEILTEKEGILPLARTLMEELDSGDRTFRLLGLSVSHPQEEQRQGIWEQLWLELEY